MRHPVVAATLLLLAARAVSASVIPPSYNPHNDAPDAYPTTFIPGDDIADVLLNATVLPRSAVASVNSQASIVQANANSASAASTATKATTSAVSASPMGLRLLYQNDMDITRASTVATRQKGYMMLTSPSTYSAASASCHALNETLVDATAAALDTNGLGGQLSFLQYEGSLESNAVFWAANGNVLTWDGARLTQSAGNIASTYRAICTQSALLHTAKNIDNSAKWMVQTQSNGLTFQG